MSIEKRIATVLAAVLMIILLMCTIASQINLERTLPHVTVESIHVDETGVIVFPPESVTCKPDGTCYVYRLIKKSGAFGKPQYFVKEVRVYTERHPDGLLTVQGLYNLHDPYVIFTSAPLQDSIQVVLQKG